MMISISDMVKNNAGKGENAAYHPFLLSLQSFQKSSISGSTITLKLRIVLCGEEH